MYDLVIIGGGPAALSAGVYAARQKLNVLLLTKIFGGQMLESYVVDNFLGMPSTPGIELIQKFTAHLKSFEKQTSQGKFDLEIKEGETAESVRQKDQEKKAGIFEVQTDKETYESKAVIIATGRAERKLDIRGAKEFEGKGISYCATCDAPIFRDKIVAVIGAGDAGQDSAWQLTKYASKVYLLNRYNELRGDDKELQERLKKDSRIEILSEVELIEVVGEKFVSGLIYREFRGKEEKKIDLDGIFVEIGSTPASLFVDGLVRCNDKGEIVIDHNTCATSVSGIFAAGDVADVFEKQIIIAAGMGAKAALAAYNYLKNK
jgi:alkyl hydroperoxide reductase subunit F